MSCWCARATAGRFSPAWPPPTCSRAPACCSSARRTRCASCTRRATATSPRCARSCAGAKYSRRTATWSRAVLRALDIRGFVLIEESSVDFADGFTVLTGETGAGKSMLVDAIELLVGGRGDAAAVRGGAERAELAAEVDVDPQGVLAAWLAERDPSGEPGPGILRRTVDGSGRSRCLINGHAATPAQLKEAADN